MIFGVKRKEAAVPGGKRIYTVPAGRPFLPALAEALLAGNLPNPGGPRPGPLELADTTLLLPTRRATRALQEAFLAASSGNALLLPRVRPIFGAADEQEMFPSAEDVAADIALPMGEMERRLTLATLVLRWSQAERAEGDDGGNAGRTPAQAAKLARELARLMDTMEIEDVDSGRMQTLVPDDLAEHWERTLRFLGIITEHWPKVAGGRNSKMQRDKRLVLELAARLLEAPPRAPIIVAGVMSSVPAVTALLRAVAALPNGAVLLPGLDQTLDEESWEKILPDHPEHPQFGLRKLLDALGVGRQDVAALPGPVPVPAQAERAKLVSEAMRPARTTERWHRFTERANTREMGHALAGVGILEAPSAEEEAEAIALILREAADTPDRTAALVTPDRVLARRVSARLESWGMRVEDSAGAPLAKTLPGTLLDLVVEATARRFAPVALISLLKHPLCRLGLPARDLGRAVRALELGAMRAPYFGHGLAGVEAALERAEADLRAGKRRHAAVNRLGAGDWQAARKLGKALSRIFRPLEAMFSVPNTAALPAIARAHMEAAQAIAATDRKGEANPLWQREAGEEAAKLFATLLDTGTFAPEMVAVDYPDFYRGLVDDMTIRPRGASHPRIFIWEPYESRLQQPDVVVLGSLNEGTWPQAADPGPWLNRPMRLALGMSAPEERIGDAAHIFSALLAGAPRVHLTRAAKVDGVPTVPSRWLLRLQALLDGMGQRAAPDRPWLAWAQARNRLAGPAQPVGAPEPRPPATLRPRKLSVTAIETWMANPYAIFAQRILRLEPLPVLGLEPDAALRGQIVHEALGRFAQRFPEELPEDIASALVACAEAALAELTGSARVAAFWAPRFERFAAWFAETEPARRSGIAKVIAEVEGAMVFEGRHGPFTLTARADRIDVGGTGLVITDYKGSANLKGLATSAVQGEAPQLPLEAAIARAGGFTGLGAAQVAALRYISTAGGEPPGQDVPLKTDDAGALAGRAQEGLERLIAAYDDPATPYKALRRARFRYDYDVYAHLARVAEWSAAELMEEAV